MAATFAPRFTAAELAEMEIPHALVRLLCRKPRTTQVWAIRRINGFPSRPAHARFKVCVDRHDIVMTIEPL